MRKLTLILQLIILISVAFLYVLHFRQVKECNGDGIQKSVFVSKDSNGNMNYISMAYINTDTVMNNYKYYQELKSKLESQQQVAEKQLEIKMQDLEKEYKNLSTRVTLGLMKEEEAQAVFAPKQQEVEKFRTNISDQLMAQEKQLTLQLYDTVINFLQKYNKKAGYSYIFGYTKGGNIMIAPKSHDLTKDVLKGLNGDYLKRK